MNSLRSLLFLLLLWPAWLRAQQAPAQPVSPLEAKFRDGLYAEEAKQDLDSAVKAYQEIVAGFDRDRETASSALFRLGEVFRKQNRPKEAAAAFRRVALEFPDRDPLARLARENLTALGEPLPVVPGAAAPAPGADPEQDKTLARLIELAKTSPDMPLNPQTSLQNNGCISYDEALRAGYVKVVTWLLEHGASPEKTPSGATPLTLAAERGHTALIELLAAKGAPIDGPADKAPQPLYAAAEKGHSAAAALLLDKGAAINGVKGWSAPLIIAANKGSKAVVDLLLQRGADPDIFGGEALVQAIQLQQAEIVPLLLAKKPDLWKITRQFQTAQSALPTTTNAVVWVAIPFNQKDYRGFVTPIPPNVKVSDGWPETEEFSMLHLACVRPDAAIVDDMIKAGADVNAGSKAGSTPLELACAFQNAAAVKRLIQAGAQVDAVAPGGLRLVDIALCQPNLEIYDLLRKAGAAVAGEAPCGATALEMLSHPMQRKPLTTEEFEKTFARLLDEGVSPDGNRRFRPVNEAAERGSTALVQLLQAKGADFTPASPVAPVTSAVEHFRESRDPACIKALLAAGADIDAPWATSVFDPYTLPSNSRQVVTRSALTKLVMGVPDLPLLEEFLKLKPDPAEARANLWEVYGSVESLISGQKGNNAYTSGEYLDRQTDAPKQPARKAILERLWQYQCSDTNPRRTDRVWYESQGPLAAKGGVPGAQTQMVIGPDGRPVQRMMPPQSGGGDSHLRPVLCPVGGPRESVSVLRALAVAFAPQRGTDPKWTSWPNWETMRPDFKQLVIRRRDAATGKILKDEPLDLAAWLEKGGTESLPVLQPGDTLVAVQTISKFESWKGFPDPLPAMITKMLSPRITVSAGDWKRTFQVRGADAWSEGVHNPASELLMEHPRVASVLRHLPKPEFFYRMGTLKLKRASGTAMDISAAPAAGSEKDLLLEDGDEITVEAVPSDDPALAARMAQGIFIGRESDGFLREVFHDPASPDVGGWTDDLKKDVLQHFCATSESILPVMETAKMTTGPVLPDNPSKQSPWGEVLNVPKDDSGKPWTEPLDWTAPDKPKPLVTAVKLKINVPRHSQTEITLPQHRGQFEYNTDRWWRVTSHTPDRGSASRALADVVDHLWLARSGWKVASRWELRREGHPQPLAVFSPDQDRLPLIFLRDGDTLSIDSTDVELFNPPSRLNVLEANQMLQTTPPLQTQPQRRRVTLPTQAR